MTLCPHCRKPIRGQGNKIGADLRKKILDLHRQGYSTRDIQEVLSVSFSSAARIIREAKANG